MAHVTILIWFSTRIGRKKYPHHFSPSLSSPRVVFLSYFFLSLAFLFLQYKLEPTPEPSDEEEDSSEEEEEAFGGAKKKKEEEDPAASGKL